MAPHPDGRMTSATAFPAEITIETSPIGQRIVVEGPVDESRWRQEIRLWADVDRIEMTTSLHDYRGRPLFRVRFRRHRRRDRDLRGWECGHRSSVRQAERGCRRSPVHARPSSVQLVRSGCDCPGGASSTRRTDPRSGIAGDRRGRDRRARRRPARLEPPRPRRGAGSAGRYFNARHDDGHRYGVLHIDSNLPDVRVAVGGPDQNRSVSLSSMPSNAGIATIWTGS